MTLDEQIATQPGHDGAQRDLLAGHHLLNGSGDVGAIEDDLGDGSGNRLDRGAGAHGRWLPCIPRDESSTVVAVGFNRYRCRAARGEGVDRDGCGDLRVGLRGFHGRHARPRDGEGGIGPKATTCDRQGEGGARVPGVSVDGHHWRSVADGECDGVAGPETGGQCELVRPGVGGQSHCVAQDDPCRG